jgi:hypothetical protein
LVRQLTAFGAVNTHTHTHTHTHVLAYEAKARPDKEVLVTFCHCPNNWRTPWFVGQQGGLTRRGKVHGCRSFLQPSGRRVAATGLQWLVLLLIETQEGKGKIQRHV